MSHWQLLEPYISLTVQLFFIVSQHVLFRRTFYEQIISDDYDDNNYDLNDAADDDGTQLSRLFCYNMMPYGIDYLLFDLFKKQLQWSQILLEHNSSPAVKQHAIAGIKRTMCTCPIHIHNILYRDVNGTCGTRPCARVPGNFFPEFIPAVRLFPYVQ